MPGRIAIVIEATPLPDGGPGTVRLFHAESLAPIDVPRLTLVLTLSHEADMTFCRGTLHFLSGNVTYPIQSNHAFFDALQQLLAAPGHEGTGAP